MKRIVSPIVALAFILGFGTAVAAPSTDAAIDQSMQTTQPAAEDKDKKKEDGEKKKD